MALKIYGIAASRASRPLWVLEELGVPYERVKVDYKDGGTRKPDMLAINPNGHIPALDDDGIVVWESMACSLYLARKFADHGELKLGAQDLKEEAEILRWTFWSVTELEKDALTVLMHRLAMPADGRDANLAEQAEKRVMVPLRVLEAHLARQPWLGGERFTVADINVASIAAWIRPAAAVMANFPAVQAWLKKCLDRPAQQRVREMTSSDAKKA